MKIRYSVTTPSGKTYTYNDRPRAEALAKKVGSTVVVVGAPSPQRCVCGRMEDTHESYDCHRDYRLTGGW